MKTKQPPTNTSAPPIKEENKCISCGSFTDVWNVCDNCWDEVPKGKKKRIKEEAKGLFETLGEALRP